MRVIIGHANPITSFLTDAIINKLRPLIATLIIILAAFRWFNWSVMMGQLLCRALMALKTGESKREDVFVKNH